MASLLGRARAAGKALLLAAVRAAFPRRAPGGPVDATAIRSVLVVRTDDRVGNLLLTTPLLAALRKRLPEVRIGLLCAARRAAVVEGTGLYDELWRFEERDLFVRPWRFAAFCLRLRRRRYDVAIEAGHWHAFSFTAGMLARWSGAKVRVGHRRGEAERLLTHAVEPPPETAHDAAAKLELLRPLGIEAAAPAAPRTALGTARAEEFRALFGPRPALLVNPGGRKADHRWPPDRLARAVEALRGGRDLGVFVAWGPGEEPLARAVAAAVPGAAVLPPTDLDALAGAMRACALFLTHDTGPMHLAAAVGVPTVAIFLSGDWRRWAWPGVALAAVPVAGLPEAAAVAAVAAAAEPLLPRR